MSVPPIVVVGTSAGGVSALQRLVERLPANLPAAVFIVAHIPAHSPSQLDRILRLRTKLDVVEAKDGAPIRGGQIVVACADRHLMVDGDCMRVTRGPRECRVRPAIDVLFRSAAAAHGPRVVGVVLTGTLDDGTAGLWAIKDRGGVALVEDPTTAEFSSMPESAIEHVAVDRVLPVKDMADEIVNRLERLPPPRAQPAIPERLRVENLIAREGNGLRAGSLEIGSLSHYTCPECHSALAQIEEGSIVRFRCHTGHAYSIKNLLADVDRAIDTGIWEAMRAVEERMLILCQMEDRANGSADESRKADLRARVKAAEATADILLGLVLGPDAKARTPEE